MPQDGNNVITDFQVRRKDGSLFYADTSISPIDLSGKACLVFFFRDVTERRRVQEELQQHRIEMTHASRLSTVGQMAASLAHELNQPLCGAMTHAEGCLRMLRGDSVDKEKLTKKLEVITQQCEYAGQVISRLRHFIEKGQPVREVVNVNVIVCEALRFMEAECRRHGTRIVWKPGKAVGPVRVDPVQLEQVLLNLIQNGLDAMKESPIAQRIVDIRSEMIDSMIAISVSDNGTGIAEKDGDTIFESFFTTKTNGLGMGLSISRSIIEAHGGQLTAKDNDHQGVTFICTLPAVKQQEDLTLCTDKLN